MVLGPGHYPNSRYLLPKHCTNDAPKFSINSEWAIHLPFFLHCPSFFSISGRGKKLTDSGTTGIWIIAIGSKRKKYIDGVVLKTVVERLYEQCLGTAASPRMGGTRISTASLLRCGRNKKLMSRGNVPPLLPSSSFPSLQPVHSPSA